MNLGVISHNTIQPTLPVSSLIHTAHPDLVSPETCNNPTQEAKDAVRSALDDLEKTGVLQHLNQMDISELLNPAVEAHQLFEATDQDIYEAVMEAKEAQEESTRSNETSDANLDDPVEPVPTCIEALQAALLLQKYTRDLDDPITHKLETMLSSFRRMTHMAGMWNMKETKLISYYPSKE